MVAYIQLFGERCSGTNFITSLITKNFKNIEMTTDFGSKHWFIKNHFPRCRPNNSTDIECIRSLNTNNSDTLFLCLFRNPFDWIRSLHARPYHAPNHNGISITQFMRKPWLSFERYQANRHWLKRNDDYWFIEEAINILQLRSMKIEHLLNLQNKVDNFYLLNYETVIKNNQELAYVANKFTIELIDSEILGENRYFGKAPNTVFSTPVYPAFEKHDIEYINQELDWKLERQIGYSQSDYNG